MPSMLTFPVPAKRSKSLMPERSWGKMLKSDSFTRSDVGRTACPFGTFRRRPLAFPPMTRILGKMLLPENYPSHRAECDIGLYVKWFAKTVRSLNFFVHMMAAFADRAPRSRRRNPSRRRQDFYAISPNAYLMQKTKCRSRRFRLRWGW
jgi:hypothetical protein